LTDDAPVRRLIPLLVLAAACRPGPPAPTGSAASAVVIEPLEPTPGELVFTGMCDASAAVRFDADHVVVADDESNVLRLYRRTGGAPVAVSADLSEAAGATPKGDGHRELDLEGAARVGDVVWWIGSHGNNKKGKARPGRHRLIATTLARDGADLRVDVKAVHRDLTSTQVLDPALGISAAPGVAPKAPGGTNIEGLAATAEGHLLVGFRSPVPDDLATVLELVVDLERPPELRSVHRVGIHGLGVRALAWGTPHMIVLAGPPGPGGGAFRVHQHPAGEATFLPPGISGEALVRVPEGLLVLSDDGTVDVGGVPCKEAPVSSRSFRGVVLRGP